MIITKYTQTNYNKTQWFLKIIQPAFGGLDKFYIIVRGGSMYNETALALCDAQRDWIRYYLAWEITWGQQMIYLKGEIE